jgi:hypothetical protein
MNGEPTMDQIDDYNGNESAQKKQTVRLVILGLIVVSAIYGAVKFNFNSVDDYIGTPQKPGLMPSK